MKKPYVPPPPPPELVYVLRPGGTALWLSAPIAVQIAARHGVLLTDDQFNSEPVQTELARRHEAETPKRKDAA